MGRRLKRGARRNGAAAALLLALAGCSSIDGPSPVLIPNRALDVSRSLSIPADVAVLAAAIVIVVDPLAPNWEIERTELGGDRFEIALRKKRFSSGGDGEAAALFQRHIDTLARERGFARYEVLEFSQGIESTVPIARRVSRGVVRFAR